MFDEQFILELGMRGLAILIRVSLIITFLPVLGEDFSPRQTRALMALALTACLVPVVDVDLSTMPTSVWGVAMAVVPEFMLGAIIGLIARMVFAGVQLAGQAAGEQIGFGIANVIDPTNSQQISITAQIYYIFALLIFLTLNGHHILLGAMVRSFETVPLFSFHFSQESFNLLMNEAANMFVIGVLVSAPILAAMLLANLCLGLVSKAVPQINIFIESFPIRIALGLFIMGLTMTAVGVLLANQFSRMDTELRTLLQLVR